MSDYLPMSRRFQWQPSRVFDFLWLHRMRPRVAKTETSRKFLRSDFRGGFNHRSERIAQLAGIFPVSVINAPELISRLRGQNWCCVHAAIEHAAASRQVRIAHFHCGVSSDTMCCVIRGHEASTQLS